MEQGNQQNSQVRVLVVDDHQVVRVGIRKLLNRTNDIRVIGEAANGMEALHLVSELNPDVLLLDMEMPGLSGVDVARNLHASGSKVRILVLSGYDDRQYVIALVDQGISGYLIKDESPELIIEAIRSIAKGSGNWYSPKIKSFIPAQA